MFNLGKKYYLTSAITKLQHVLWLSKKCLADSGIWSALCPSRGFFMQKNFKNLYLSKNWENCETFLYMEAVLCPTVRMIT